MSSLIKILSLSCIYPTRHEPTRGVFIRARLESLSRKLSVRVVAPIPWIAWGTGIFPRAKARSSQPAPADAIPVLRPRWFQLPRDTWLNGPLLAIQLLPQLLWEWRRAPWDVIDAHFASPEGLAAALLACIFPCRFTITLRGRELVQARHQGTARILAWTLRRAERVFAVSAELERLAWHLGVSRERTCLIPNGIDPTLFHPLDRAAVRSELGIDAKLQLVLVVARIHPVKGVLAFLDCLPRLLQEFPRLTIVVAGGAGRGAVAYAQRVEDRTREPDLQGRVHLIGLLPQSQVVRWMNAADILCLPSQREGCPNVVLEALACGLPVLATAVGAVPDLLAEANTGLVVPPNDSQALEDGLRRCLGRDWPVRMPQQAGAIRRWDHVAEELAQAFSEMCRTGT
jgi:teichuronic acid biosynthesis glycosyltransferase TuaC